MDMTSLDAARIIPPVVAVGLVALVLLPYRAVRSTADACCPARAAREAAATGTVEATATVAEPVAEPVAAPVAAPVPRAASGSPALGRQRGVGQKADR